MTLVEYVSQIKFRYYQTDYRHPILLRKILKLLAKCHLSLEIVNTVLPEHEKEMKSKLDRICKIPKMSTFAIGAIINRTVSCLPDDACFVNVGVWNGFSFLSGITGHPDKTCIGVDNFSQFGGPKQQFLKNFESCRGPRHHFHDMDYVDYFAKVHTEPIGFYIYDGPHSREHQLQGLQLAEPHFAPGCIVLVDDTNWPRVREANCDFISNSSHEYEMLLDKTTTGGDHPTFWNGVMMFRMC